MDPSIFAHYQRGKGLSGDTHRKEKLNDNRLASTQTSVPVTSTTYQALMGIKTECKQNAIMKLLLVHLLVSSFKINTN